MKRLLFSIFATQIAVFAILLSCSHIDREKKATTTDDGVVHVKIVQVVRDTAALPIIIPGKLTASEEIKLSFKTGGVIREVHATEGATVKRGQRIASLDTVEIAAWRDKACIALDKAERDCDRIRKLNADGAATLELLQNAESSVRAARADSAITASNFSQAVVTAPCDGKILKRLTEKNEVIGPGMPVALFASTEGAWTVTSALVDRDLADVSIGDRAEVRFDALPQDTFAALLVRIAGAAHPVTGTFEIELALGRTHPILRQGLFGEVRLFAQGRRNLAFIPASALVRANGDTGTVYVVGTGDVVYPATVTIARFFGDRLAISSGLDNVDNVVAAGAAYVPGHPHPVIDHNSENAPCRS